MSVIFDQLRISDDGKQLFINAHVNNAQAVDASGSLYDPYEKVYIKGITIVDANTVAESLDIDSIKKWLFKEYFYKEVNGVDVPYLKELNLVLNVNNFLNYGETELSKIDYCQEDMYKTLFFVYIETTQAEDTCLPCYMNRPYTVGVTFDEGAFYQKVMNYTRELAQDCETMPKGFVDFILQWNAFKTSVETEHFLPAIKFYNLMFGNASSPGVYTSTKGCGCHGRSRL